jgi:hypothetical protein
LRNHYRYPLNITAVKHSTNMVTLSALKIFNLPRKCKTIYICIKLQKCSLFFNPGHWYTLCFSVNSQSSGINIYIWLWFQMSDTTKKDVEKKTDLLAFMEHCCQTRHYTFQIKKCGKPNCKICKWETCSCELGPVRMILLTRMKF